MSTLGDTLDVGGKEKEVLRMTQISGWNNWVDCDNLYREGGDCGRSRLEGRKSSHLT